MKKVILSFILFVVFFTGICQQKTAIQIIFEPVFGNGDLATVTTGGTGFGVMSMVVATERGWVTREAAVNRLLQIVSFLQIVISSCTRGDLFFEKMV